MIDTALHMKYTDKFGETFTAQNSGLWTDKQCAIVNDLMLRALNGSGKPISDDDIEANRIPEDALI